MTFTLPPSLPGEAPSDAEVAWLTSQGVYARNRENFALWERNIAHIIGGGQAHKRPVKYLLRGGPAFTARAKGSRFWDVDGHEFIDYLLGYMAPLFWVMPMTKSTRLSPSNLDAERFSVLNRL